MDTVQNRDSPHFLLSLDAEKAFDTIHWSFMRRTLEKFGFGPVFREWLALLYTAPEAKVPVNGAIVTNWPVQRGTRQGCPLSPLLFALILEPLGCVVRSYKGLGSLIDESRLLEEDPYPYMRTIFYYMLWTQPRQSQKFYIYMKNMAVKRGIRLIGANPPCTRWEVSEPQTYPSCLQMSTEGFN